MQSQNRKRTPAWTERDVLDLITVWGDESVLSELHSKRQNANIFAKISRGMMDRGYNGDPQQCHVKIKELRQAYQKTKEANGRFYDELDAWKSRELPYYYPTPVHGHLQGRESHATGMRILGMRKMRRRIAHSRQAEKPFSPTARNCFITLEPIPSQTSQGGLLDHEAREGTSAANVSTLPLSSPSQRLAQIRRRKKSTRDEIFSELMQSSCTERAPQNVWRQTMSKSRKAENECDDRRDEQDERWWQRNERRQDKMLRLLGDQTDMLRRLVELQERQQAHKPPLQPLCNRLPFSSSSIASSPRRPRMQAGEAPGTQPLHPRGLPKQQKAGIQ
ncbi:uncharacterized protein [Lepidochelys kempii]|uniref:uncharacterized protein n=1 Tax=Lepidochelys kempii TaxID=8472 RepID=UPI003C6FEB5E